MQFFLKQIANLASVKYVVLHGNMYDNTARW